MKNKDLANLHEELLHFLLNYRNESKYTEHPNFLFRPSTDVEALREGRWFYDSPKSGWVNIYFTESDEKRHHQNSLQFGVNLNGEWNISLYVLNYPKLGLFWDHLIQSFSNVTRRKQNSSKQITLLPIDKNYRTGLSEAIDTLFQFLRQEYDYYSISLVPEDIFQESLRAVNEYRSQQKVKQIYLNGFQIKNYQGIKDTQLDDLPPNPSWIFLTGENGFGKTCLLKALAIGLYGNEEDIIVPRDKASDIRVTYSYAYESDRKININNKIEHPLFFRPLQALAAYGPSRLEIQAQDSHTQQAKNSTATYNLFNTDGILKNIESELLISYYDNEDKFKFVCKMLKALIPSLDKIELDKKRRKILYYEKAQTDKEETDIFDPIEYEHLASGMKSIVAMAGDIYLRLSDAQEKMQNSLLKKAGLETSGDDHAACAPDELFGIVMIDELDLHLHPKWQRELPALLSKVFPNVQFVASTHSVISFLGAPENSVFLKVTRNREQGIQIERVEIDIRNLLPNTLLTSPLFDMERLSQRNNKNLAEVRTEDSYI